MPGCRRGDLGDQLEWKRRYPGQKGGEVAERIVLSLRAYSCILGGPERRDLYLTTAAPGMFADLQDKRSGRIEVIEVSVPGAGLP